MVFISPVKGSYPKIYLNLEMFTLIYNDYFNQKTVMKMTTGSSYIIDHQEEGISLQWILHILPL